MTTSVGDGDELRAFIVEIIKQSKLDFDPATGVKGVIVSIEDTAIPPTVTINIGGNTSVSIAGVRMASNYTPMVGQTVVLHKQGDQLAALYQIADGGAFSDSSGGGWITATLAGGSHDGNSNGNVEYRKVLDHGSWKMQWRGGWAPSGGVTMVSGLPVPYRPKSRCTVTVARNAAQLNDVKLDFEPDGSVNLVGGATGTTSASGSGDVFSTTPFTSLSGYLSQGGSDLGHNHGSHDHGFSGGSHTHTTPQPTWVSLNNVEYFL